MIKLNLDQVAKLEKQNANNSIYLNTLQHMVNILMMPADPMGLDNQSATTLALNTLMDLGVIEQIEDRPKDIQQLNS
jgi:hypothetical protein